MYEKLFNNLENVKAIFENMSIIPAWFEEVRVAIDNMWTKIKSHYTKTKNPPAYVDANILHPGKKLHLFKKKDSSFTENPGQAGIYEKAACVRFDKLYNNSVLNKSMDEPSNSLKRKRTADSDSDDSSDDDDQFNAYNEFDHYLRIKRDKTVTDALVWWRNSHGMFPKMGMWYRDVGAVPASSAGVEREFSMAGDIVTKKRNRLSGKTISNIMQYKRWRARRGEHIIIEEPREIPEEYDEEDSDVESEFEERNIELEEWLAEWMEKKDVGEAARGLFSDEA
jgi:hypothetical protein